MLEEGKASEEDANLILEGQEETELGQAPPARRHHVRYLLFFGHMHASIISFDNFR